MGYDVQIERLGHRAVIDLKGTKQAIGDWAGSHLPDFPQTPNTASAADGLELCWIGSDHWLLFSTLDREEALLQAMDLAAAPTDVSAVRISDTLEFFSIKGGDAWQIMAIASPLDTSPRTFGENAVTYSEAFGLKVLIMQRPGGFELAIERSYADMTQDYFTRIQG